MATGENVYTENHPGYKSLLFVEPSNEPSAEPLIDELTCKMTAAWRARPTPDFMYSYFGYHTCECGANSDCDTHVIEDKYITNSLCIHYLAFHRDEVPQIELDKVSKLEYDPVEPTVEEMAVPDGNRRDKFICPQRIPRTPVRGTSSTPSRVTRRR